MNELKFLEAIGKIDGDLIKEADVEKKKTFPKRKIYAFGSAAAVAAVAFGSVLLFNSYGQSSSVVDNSIIQPNNNGENSHTVNSVFPVSSAEESKQDSRGLNSNNSKTENLKDESVNDVSKQPSTDTSSQNISSEPVDNSISQIAESQTEDESANNVSEQTSTDTSSQNISSAPVDNSISQIAESQTEDESVNNVSEQTSTYTSSQNVSSAPIDNSIPQITESQTEHNPNTQSTKYYYQPFSAKIVPGSKSFGGDGFGEEELHHIDVRTSEGFYEQLALDEYASNGISSTVSKTDFGEYIGKIIEVDNSYEYHGNAAESQEPTLAGADVYYYAPKGNNKAFIIVKQNEQCSIFFANEINTSEGFKNGFLFFNVQGAEDIMSVEYQKCIPDGDGKMILSEQNVITDSTAVKDFYDLVCQLKPEDYSGLPEFAATPLWYIEAWDKYKANPDAFVMEDYSVIITLKDGTVLREIRYQPFLANGYVENMQELTPEQNSTLKNLLK